MTPKSVKRLEVGNEVASGSFRGKVMCIDLTDDDKIVIKWDCAESEDVLSDTSPLWSRIEPLPLERGALRRLAADHLLPELLEIVLGHAAGLAGVDQPRIPLAGSRSDRRGWPDAAPAHAVPQIISEERG